MDPDTLTAVGERYPWASWAVWDEAFPDGECVEESPEQLVEFIEERSGTLTPSVVLLGLNRSDDLSGPFTNFHAPTRTHFDYRLKETIQDGGLTRLRGAYMTDLVDEVNSNSGNVHVTEEDASILLEQLRLLGAEEYHVVCFGNKPFDALVAYFDADVSMYAPELKHATVEFEGLELHLYRAWFYGLYGATQDKVPVFKDQLRALNGRLA